MLILGAWLGWLALRERTPAAWRRVALVAGIGAAFGAYYFVFLPGFPAHRALTAVWSNAHEVSLFSILLEVGPWVAVAAWRLHRRRGQASDAERFWIVALAVTFLLMQHDWFMSPRQPAHFSRGYLWLPAWFLALPQLQEWSQRFAARGPRVAGLALALGGTLIAADNAAFLTRDLHVGEQERIQLSRPQREILTWMDEAELRGVLLSYDPRLNYLAPAYSGVRPYVGHLNNTPEIRTRWSEVAAWQQAGKTGPWFDRVDYLLIDRRNPPAYNWSGWRELHRNDDYLIFGRPSKP